MYTQIENHIHKARETIVSNGCDPYANNNVGMQTG